MIAVSTSLYGSARMSHVPIEPMIGRMTFTGLVASPRHIRVVSGSIVDVAITDKTLNHSHPNNVSILLTDYNAKVTTPDGKTNEVHFKVGSAIWREAGTHVVENIGKEEMKGIIVEPKKHD
jgi:hypothetical protein